MTTDLATISGDIQQARATVAQLRAAITQTGDVDVVVETRDRVRLAREWARIHGLVQEVHHDLLRLDIECLRRVAQLGGIKELPPSYRLAATFFGSLNDAEIDALLAEHGGRSTALGIYLAIERARREEGWRRDGRRFATGAYAGDGNGPDDASMREMHRTTVKAALEVLLEDFSSQSFSIAEIADEVLAATGIDSAGDEGLRKGVSEVCRDAVRRAPALFVGSLRAPRFVTCLRDDSSTIRYLRVPFETATLPQLDQMIALRREQLEQDAAALAHLEALAAELATHGTTTEPLGAIAERCLDARADEAAA